MHIALFSVYTAQFSVHAAECSVQTAKCSVHAAQCSVHDRQAAVTTKYSSLWPRPKDGDRDGIFGNLVCTPPRTRRKYCGIAPLPLTKVGGWAKGKLYFCQSFSSCSQLKLEPGRPREADTNPQVETKSGSHRTLFVK